MGPSQLVESRLHDDKYHLQERQKCLEWFGLELRYVRACDLGCSKYTSCHLRSSRGLGNSPILNLFENAISSSSRPSKSASLNGESSFFGIARKKVLAEFWSCHNFDMLRKLLELPAVIEVIVTENERFHILEINTTFSQNVDSIAGNIQPWESSWE